MSLVDSIGACPYIQQLFALECKLSQQLILALNRIPSYVKKGEFIMIRKTSIACLAIVLVTVLLFVVPQKILALDCTIEGTWIGTAELTPGVDMTVMATINKIDLNKGTFILTTADGIAKLHELGMLPEGVSETIQHGTYVKVATDRWAFAGIDYVLDADGEIIAWFEDKGTGWLTGCNTLEGLYWFTMFRPNKPPIPFPTPVPFEFNRLQVPVQ
jgi:hypothetical protein